jgi:glutamate racemase
MEAGALKDHILSVMEGVIARLSPAAVVIACNTASTLVLEPLRAAHRLPFVGTVPAIKPAAERSETSVFSVLATPATIERDYTRDLITRFAAGCHVRLVGAPDLARVAEAHLLDQPIDRDHLAGQIAPCFYEAEGRRSDIVVLACTHYPFLTGAMDEVSPWAVTWLDPAPAIARRLKHVIGGRALAARGAEPVLLTSGNALDGAQSGVFAAYGFSAAD